VQGRAADEKFARLRRGQRIWAVASIHGESERLGRLHDRIAERFRDGDRIVYLGNYLGRGSAVTASLPACPAAARRREAPIRGCA